MVTAKLVINATVPTSEELVRLFPHIQAGGHWQPDHCRQRQKLGILVPLRNRWSHLAVLLRHLHQLLVRQWRDYRYDYMLSYLVFSFHFRFHLHCVTFSIFVIEQAGNNENSKKIKLQPYYFAIATILDNAPFNRGKLLNIGVIEAIKIEPDLNCFILHDVDTLPETVFTIYKCHEDPRMVVQMATYQMKRNYK